MYVYKQSRCPMGIRSDVILCIRNEVYRALSDASKATIKDYFGAYADRIEAGMLFEVDEVKWYHDDYADLIYLYKDLEALGMPDDFLILVATPEYPNTDDSDFGDWTDNPWCVNKQVTCCVEWHHAE